MHVTFSAIARKSHFGHEPDKLLRGEAAFDDQVFASVLGTAAFLHIHLTTCQEFDLITDESLARLFAATRALVGHLRLVEAVIEEGRDRIRNEEDARRFAAENPGGG